MNAFLLNPLSLVSLHFFKHYLTNFTIATHPSTELKPLRNKIKKSSKMDKKDGSPPTHTLTTVAHPLYCTLA